MGGLFVPATIPSLPPNFLEEELNYKQTAQKVLESFLTDFNKEELQDCIQSAYNHTKFDVDDVVDLKHLDNNRWVLELWHGPTAAFKDVALQIMPYFMDVSKRKLKEQAHTVILVATSGDTGKAALEGFKNCKGVSIIVFYPHEGVSEIQKLQMETTDGNNTYVVAVKGNFDDCQTGVKKIFGDNGYADELRGKNFELSSANSINWGRLCPQIVYYVRAYQMLLERGVIAPGGMVDFCVPTGNFGNILAAYYALRLGIPIRQLICASNKNKVLADFFTSGIYDKNREFYKTISPSMDILISSNLERFLFEMSNHDSAFLRQIHNDLNTTGKFTVNNDLRNTLGSIIQAGWVDENKILETIGSVFRDTGYVLDTHTAVGVALCEGRDAEVPVVIASTASPFKFSTDVLRGMTQENQADEFVAIDRIREISGMTVHRALHGLKERQVRHNKVIQIDEMKSTVQEIINNISNP